MNIRSQRDKLRTHFQVCELLYFIFKKTESHLLNVSLSFMLSTDYYVK